MDIPQPRYARRILLALFLASSALLLLIIFVLIPVLFHASLPSARGVLNSVLLSLFTSVATTGVAAIALDWLLPRPARTAQAVRVIDPRERDEAIEQARRGTERWWFTGGLGRYNRAVVLPELARRARAQNVTIAVTLLMLDPDDPDLCARYARLRLGLRSGKASMWTSGRVRTELLATITSAYCLAHAEPLLNVTIGLKNTCSLLRTEISTHTVIVTTEEPHAVGLAFPRDSAFYDLYSEEFRLSMSQSRVLPSSAKTFAISEVTAENLVEFLMDIGLCSTDLEPNQLEEIRAAILEPRHQYQ
jgi:hypothetical protein